MKKTLYALVSKNPYDTALTAIYMLNVTDYLFTLILLSGGLFVEVNPLLSMNINGTGGFVLKCLLPLALMVYLHTRFSISPPKNPKPVRWLLGAIIGYYGIINAFHIFWLTYSIVMFQI